jgi:hypothetical protein
VFEVADVGAMVEGVKGVLCWLVRGAKMKIYERNMKVELEF